MKCPHGQRALSSCLPCMTDGPLPPAPKEEPRIAYVFPAKLSSFCDHCGEQIDEGENVARLTTDFYVHPLCALEVTR